MGKELEACRQATQDFQSSNSVVFLQQGGGNSGAAARLAELTWRLADRRLELHEIQSLTFDENMERISHAYPGPGKGVETNAGVGPAGVANSATNNPPANDATGLGPTPPNLGAFEEIYLNARQQLFALQIQRQDLTNSYPDLVVTSSDLAAIDRRIATQEKMLEIYKEQSEEELRNHEHRLKLEIQDLQSAISEWETNAIEASKRLAEFDALKEKRQALQAQYDQIQANLQALDLNKGIGQESVLMFEPATPSISVLPNPVKHLVMG